MIAATVIALLALPLVVLRGRTLLAYFGTAAATSLFAWLLWRRMPGIEPRMGFAAVAVIQLATFSLFLAAGRNVRWSAARAAVLAAIVYALTIPAMLHNVIDGDEPFYLLVTESIVRDLDLDLANQYRTLVTSESGRLDLVPQLGDPRGTRGEQYSRHEPFLPLLMVPGYLLAGLHGAIATIALFGVLLVRSTVRWMEDEGIGEHAVRAVFPLFAFGPPILFYATRIWPEVPAAFFFVEALRGVRAHRPKRWLPALFGLVMLKLRFVLVAVGVIATVLVERRRSTLIALAIILVPIATIWLITGDPTNVHTWRELIPTSPRAYLIGLSGLLADGMSGIAFQAPFYLFALVALTRWRDTPPGFRMGMLASLLYLFYLIPRGEWFGGWAPPLRYLVFLMPVLALGIAAVWDQLSRGAIALVSAWTVALVIHGLAHPAHLFHEFTGENWAGEWLSNLYDRDFSRFFPSFIRVNEAAWWGLLAVIAFAFAVRRQSRRPESESSVAALQIAIIALAIGIGFHFAKQPASRVDFEDAHVIHEGGELYPGPFTVVRTAYRGGWVLEEGDSASFLARDGRWTLDYITGLGATIELANQAYVLPAGERYQSVPVAVPRAGRVTLRVVSGAVNLDRMERE